MSERDTLHRNKNVPGGTAWCLAVVFLLSIIAAQAHAQNTWSWNSTATDPIMTEWQNLNWVQVGSDPFIFGAPQAGDTAIISNTGMVSVSNVAPSVANLYVGALSGPLQGSLATFNNLGITVDNQLAVGRSGPSGVSALGTMDVAGGMSAGNVDVGVAESGLPAQGELRVDQGMVISGNLVRVGVVEIPGAAVATGTLVVQGELSRPASPGPDLALIIGSGSGGTGTGAISVGSVGLDGGPGGILLLGDARHVGMEGVGQGTFTVTDGGALSFNQVYIGRADSQDPASAEGTLSAGGVALRASGSDAVLTVGTVSQFPGATQGPVAATGVADLERIQGFQTMQVGRVAGSELINVSVAGAVNVGSGGIVGLGPGGGSTLEIGVVAGESPMSPVAGSGTSVTGTVTVQGGDVSGLGRIDVGRADGFGSAAGTLHVDGGSGERASLSAAELRVGQAVRGQQGQGSGPQAQGVVTFTSVDVDLGSRLEIGTNFGPGTGQGLVTLQDVGLTALRGVVGSGDVGAFGELRATGSTAEFGQLTVGFSPTSQANMDAFAAGGTVQESLVFLSSGSILTVSELPLGGGSSAMSQGNLDIGVFHGRGRVEATQSTINVANTLTVGGATLTAENSGSGELNLISSGLRTMDLVIGNAAEHGTAATRLLSSEAQITDTLRVEASGLLDLNNSKVTAPEVVIEDGEVRLAGASQFSGETLTMGSGLLSLEESILEFDEVMLGPGLLTSFAIGSTGTVTRMTSQGAIELDGGRLEVSFLPGFSSAFDMFTFDLITAGSLLGNFTDTSLMNVAIAAPVGFLASHGTIQRDNLAIWQVTLTAAHVIPEPSTLLLVLLGLAGLGVMARRRRLV